MRGWLLKGRLVSIRLETYRKLQRSLVEKWLLPAFMKRERLAEEKSRGISSRMAFSRETQASSAVGFGCEASGRLSADVGASAGAGAEDGVKSRRAWFHAASVGELESLWGAIEHWEGELILTVFSDSAEGHLKKLRTELEAAGRKILFSGYAPWEGRWGEALALTKAELFVTAKYEAWPELWASLFLAQVPLAIVGARPRRSLRVAARICQALVGGLPRMLLLAADSHDGEGLRGLFPRAEIEVSGDPRWDRVKARADRGNDRAKALMTRYARLPRPWGIVGSAWKKDLELFCANVEGIQGTLWVVPHSLDRENLRSLEATLGDAELGFHRSSQTAQASRSDESTEDGSDRGSVHGPDVVLVDEMGFLSELYGAADWAYVGGGFGAGIHSTIEPAIRKIPVAAGPLGMDRFPETAFLKGQGLLTEIQDDGELGVWLKRVQSRDAAQVRAERERWESAMTRQLGATHRVHEALVHLASISQSSMLR